LQQPKRKISKGEGGELLFILRLKKRGNGMETNKKKRVRYGARGGGGDERGRRKLVCHKGGGEYLCNHLKKANLQRYRCPLFTAKPANGGGQVPGGRGLPFIQGKGLKTI